MSETRVGDPISGRWLSRMEGGGRLDWWYVPVSKLVERWETSYYAFESKREADKAVREHREAKH